MPVRPRHRVLVELFEQIDGFARELADELVILVELAADLELVLRERRRRNPDGDLLPLLRRVDILFIHLDRTDAAQHQELGHPHSQPHSNERPGARVRDDAPLSLERRWECPFLVAQPRFLRP